MGVVIYNKNTNKIEMTVLQYPLVDRNVFESFLNNTGNTRDEYAYVELTSLETAKAFTHEIVILDRKIYFDKLSTPFPEVEMTPSEADQLREKNLELQLALAEAVEKQESDKITNQLAIAELVEKQEQDKLTNQLALAEMIETLNFKGVL